MDREQQKVGSGQFGGRRDAGTHWTSNGVREGVEGFGAAETTANARPPPLFAASPLAFNLSRTLSQPPPITKTPRSTPRGPTPLSFSPSPNTAIAEAPRRKKRAHPRQDDSDSDIEILSFNPNPATPISTPRSSPSKASTKQKRSPTSAPSTPSTSRSPKKRSRKPPSTITEVWKRDKKMGAGKIQENWRTLANYIDRLREAAAASPPKSTTLASFRILVVHPDITNGHSSPNRIDAYLVERLGELAELGANFVKPAEFVARSPANADTEEWTTHILVPEIVPGLRIPFPLVLGCVGGGIGVDQLGEGVEVVKEQWVWDHNNSMRRKGELPDARDYRLADDPRWKKGSSALEKKSSRRVGKGKMRAVEDEYDTEEEEEYEGGRRRVEERMQVDVSPFGFQDYPSDDVPPLYPISSSTSVTTSPFDDPSRADDSSMPASSSSSSPPALGSFPGLEKEMALIALHGPEMIDLLLDLDDDDDKQAQAPSSSVAKLGQVAGQDATYWRIIAGDESDNETEEEKEEEERQRVARRSGGNDRGESKKAVKNVSARLKGYICDQSSTGGAKTGGPNSATAAVLEHLARLSDDRRRKTAYFNAASALRNHPVLVKTASAAKRLPGIGESISSKIPEIVQTGTHRRLQMNSKRESAISSFCGIYGVGQTIALQLWDAGARNLTDLEDSSRFNLDKNQKLGLRYYKDLQERIPRDEVTEIHQLVLESARKIDPKLQVLAMGSYRRGQSSSSDVDFIVTRDTSDGIDHTGMIKKLWHALEARGIARHNLTDMRDWSLLDPQPTPLRRSPYVSAYDPEMPSMLHGLCSLPVKGAKMRRVDFLGVPFDELPSALIYFTGNQYFNRSIRLKARHLGYRLNQRGLYKNICLNRDGAVVTEGTRVECRTEKDIFDKLGVPWRPPEERRP